MSAEPNRRKPYGTDLRWRVVYQRIGMNLPLKEIAANLMISISTVCRVCAHFERTGSGHMDLLVRGLEMSLFKEAIHLEELSCHSALCLMSTSLYG